MDMPYFEAEKLPSEFLAERMRAGHHMRLTVSSRQVLPREFRTQTVPFSMFNGSGGEDGLAGGGYDEGFDDPAGLVDTLPPDPSPFAENGSEEAILAVLQQALDAVADIDRDDPAFEESMREVYPTLTKAMFSGGDEYTHRLTITTEAWLAQVHGEWVLSYPEPAENGLGQTFTMLSIPRQHASPAEPSDHDGAEKSIRIQRDGEMANVLVLVEGRRIVTSYYIAAVGKTFDLCVYTRRLDWDFDPERGGSIFMDYIVEIRGADVQRTTLRLDLKPFAKKTEGERTE